jgi:hypothetical protein
MKRIELIEEEKQRIIDSYENQLEELRRLTNTDLETQLR